MITRLSLNCVASFSQAASVAPTKVNYIYGANASGKTTISRVIANPGRFSNCGLDWQAGTQLQTLVYNKDFVEENFRQDAKLKGIFTLGKVTPEIEAEIEQVKTSINTSVTRLEEFNTTLTKKNQDNVDLRTTLTEEVWTFKKKYETDFKESLAGSVKTKELFLSKCEEAQQSSAELLDVEEIRSRYNSVYKQTLIPIDNLQPLNVALLPAIETKEIFAQAIVGKSESQVGELISHLGNSDWVDKGLLYLPNSNHKCPFCQQPITVSLQLEIENFFDNSFKEKKAALDTAVSGYASHVSAIIRDLEDLAAREIPVHKFTELPKLLQIAKEVFNGNMLLLQSKLNSPSAPVSLKSLAKVFADANDEINIAQKKVAEHNRVVSNVVTEKASVKSLVWKKVADDTSAKITAYTSKANGNNRAITALSAKVEEESAAKREKETRLRDLESQITSVAHTVKEINRILESFHFNSFRLAEASSKGHYIIVRSDKSDARETLSEGEFTFISFLYFFYRVKGSLESSGVISDRVVAIDDPISSLDSNVLFIVSNLIRSLVRDCKNNSGNIKQVFILTHNIYFHKEVTFLGSRDNQSKEESFWIVRKSKNGSIIRIGDKNQVQTTYELLWSEIREESDLNPVTVFNTLRRILEYYFKIVGHIEYERLVDEFEFEDKQAYRALISWINDGSHSVNDDLLVDIELEAVERYLSVFKDIFEKLGHISHYNMMMRVPPVATPATA